MNQKGISVSKNLHTPFVPSSFDFATPRLKRMWTNVQFNEQLFIALNIPAFLRVYSSHPLLLPLLSPLCFDLAGDYHHRPFTLTSLSSSSSSPHLPKLVIPSIFIPLPVCGDLDHRSPFPHHFHPHPSLLLVHLLPLIASQTDHCSSWRFFTL